MTIKKGTTSELFACDVCEKIWEDHKDARKKAYAHAKATGHQVRGEVGVYYVYTPPKKEENDRL